MKIALSTDLRAAVVDHIVKWLADHGHEVSYFGPKERGGEADWPLVTQQAAESAANGACDEAIVLCWTGTGAAICANKVRGVRAALCGDAETAKGARKWNHANVLALSIRLTTAAVADEILAAWFSEPFSDDAWNKTQVSRITAMEEQGA